VSQISAGTCSYALPCALDWLLQPVLLESATSSCCCTFSSNFCVVMVEQLCSNPWRNNFVEGKIWDHPSKTTQDFFLTSHFALLLLLFSFQVIISCSHFALFVWTVTCRYLALKPIASKHADLCAHPVIMFSPFQSHLTLVFCCLHSTWWSILSHSHVQNTSYAPIPMPVSTKPTKESVAHSKNRILMAQNVISSRGGSKKVFIQCGSHEGVK